MRNNLDRLGLDTKEVQQSESPLASLQFVVPTEYVDLPSKGKYYPESHPLHGKDTIEIRYMTAKDEDTLTNQSLLKKGIALEKVIEDIIVDKKIKPDILLVGDKNAIIVAARKSAYGSEYITKVTCPSCDKSQKYNFDLDSSCNIKEPLSDEEVQELDLVMTEQKTFLLTLPVTKIQVEIKMITGRDETFITNKIKELQAAKKEQPLLSLQLRTMIKSIQGDIVDPSTITEIIDRLPARDSKHIRNIYQKLAPNLDLTHTFECNSCSYEGLLEVPFTSDFFWPK